jgi:hypothetical protein
MILKMKAFPQVILFQVPNAKNELIHFVPFVLFCGLE